MKKYWFMAFWLMFVGVFTPKQVSADICYPQRVINMYACNPKAKPGLVCDGTNTPCTDHDECSGYQACNQGVIFTGYGCDKTDQQFVNCSGEASGCKWTGVAKCKSAGADCNPNNTVTLIYYCWGPGDETHKACSDGSCVNVSGGGADLCTSNDQCGGGGGDSHLECQANSCVSVSESGVDACSVNADCLPSYDISGGVYLDDTGSGDKSSPVANAGTVGITGQPLGVVGADGLWSIAGVPDGETYAATLTGLDAQYTCDDPADCELPVTLNGANVADADFFVTSQRDAWWQTLGGDVGSNISNIVSNIPNSCIEPVCYPYLSRGSTDNSGVFTYFAGINSFGEGEAGEGEDYVAQAQIPVARGFEGYDYFYRKFEMGIEPVDDFSIKTNVDKPDQVIEQPVNGRAYFSGGDLDLGGVWNVVPGESIVVFVDGNLNVDVDVLTDTGGFVAFVVSGDITLDTGVVDPTSEVGQVEGVFIADGSINVTSGTDKFVGEGIFVGWGGVSLGRDFDSLDNNTDPAELFVHRPDFVTGAPDRMKRPVMRWEEVAP